MRVNLQFANVLIVLLLAGFGSPARSQQLDKLIVKVCKTADGYAIQDDGSYLQKAEGRVPIKKESGQGGQVVLKGEGFTATLWPFDNNVLTGMLEIKPPNSPAVVGPYTITPASSSSGGACGLVRNVKRDRCKGNDYAVKEEIKDNGQRVVTAKRTIRWVQDGKPVSREINVFTVVYGADGQPDTIIDNGLTWTRTPGTNTWTTKGGQQWQGTARIDPITCRLIWDGDDCSTYIRRPDGGIVSNHPDGTREEREPCSILPCPAKWYDAQGNLVRIRQRGPDGGMKDYVIRPQGDSARPSDTVYRDPNQVKGLPPGSEAIEDKKPAYSVGMLEVRSKFDGKPRGAELDNLADKIVGANAAPNGDVNFAGYCGILKDIGGRQDLTEMEKLYLHQKALDKLFASFYQDDGHGNPILGAGTSESNPNVKTKYHLYPDCQKPFLDDERKQRNPDCSGCAKEENLSINKAPNNIRHQILRNFTQDGYHYQVAAGKHPEQSISHEIATLLQYPTTAAYEGNIDVLAHEIAKAFPLLTQDRELFPPPFYAVTAYEDLWLAAALPEWARTEWQKKILERLYELIDKGDMNATNNTIDALQQGLFKDGMKGFADKWCENFVKPECIKKLADAKKKKQIEECQKRKNSTNVQLQVPNKN